MRAVLCTAFGSIKALNLTEAAEPQLAANDFLIDVHAASGPCVDTLIVNDPIKAVDAESETAG